MADQALYFCQFSVSDHDIRPPVAYAQPAETETVTRKSRVTSCGLYRPQQFVYNIPKFCRYNAMAATQFFH